MSLMREARGARSTLHSFLKSTGVPLAAKFAGMDPDVKHEVLAQIAEVFKRIQSFKLPDSVKTCGGLNFSDGGPCNSLSELYAEYFRTQIAFADKCDNVRGWKDSELLARLERFGNEGPKSLVERVDARLTLVHGDSCMETL
ncbi:hypothetical protein CSHISOI_08903 [Colletotrichum shisoi]|uniref:Uncharacterized protein n=1 Tax=Colletotrichum shisoi TaxID=2078593 RepID=A0A5Q4BIV5_9PEZI|nr:hypothetical protein CSHISOI_08903 [Colletotrichum shisoi]